MPETPAQKPEQGESCRQDTPEHVFEPVDAEYGYWAERAGLYDE